MLQVAQDLRSGATRVEEAPEPIALPGRVVVACAASVLSSGTERYVVELARKSLIGKARARPDHVLRVLEKLRREGLRMTARQVVAKLDEPMPLGASAAGIVLEVGRGVEGFAPGDRVAAAAPHAGVVAVGKNLCARVPDGVPLEQAAYAGVSAIALQAVRLARVGLGDRVLVVGVGLMGLLAVALLRAQGCTVVATDIDPSKLPMAADLGAVPAPLDAARDAAATASGGHGVDAAIVATATGDDGPMELAADACRPKGRVVLLGTAGLRLGRAALYRKELEVTVSCSLGAGRYDAAYEERGLDYPIGHARWTVQRNMEAALEAIARGTLPVERLTTHAFPIHRAEAAYELLAGKREAHLGILLRYEAEARKPRTRIELPPRRARGAGALRVGVVGAGNFARLVLIPAIAREAGVELRGICSAGGLSAAHVGRGAGFAFAATLADEVIDDPETDAIVIATRHDAHATLAVRALRAGKHVFVEKPLCIDERELAALTACVDELGARCPVLTAGHNRRFAPALERLRACFANVAPLSVSYRFATPVLPLDHWVHDAEAGGGRLVGEACHAIDACTAIVGSPPVRVHAEAVGGVGDRGTTQDRAVVTMRHDNGALSTVSYQAAGDPMGPKERIEVFGGARTGILEDWGELALWSNGRCSRERFGKDKGHDAELGRFVEACRRGGAWPIPWAHLRGVAWASLAAMRSLREGGPVQADPLGGEEV